MGNQSSSKLSKKTENSQSIIPTIISTFGSEEPKTKTLKQNRFTDTKQLIIFGLIRTNWHLMSNPENISQDIIDLCLLFYSAGGLWDLERTDPRLSVDNENLTISKTTHDICRHYAFGLDQTQKFQKRVWSMIIIENGYDTPSMSIGIIDVRKIGKNGLVTNELDYLYQKKTYRLLTKSGVVCHGQYTKSYCEPLKGGDLVVMTLDLSDRIKNRGKLSFRINGDEYGIAWNDIDIRKVYSLCVAITGNDTLKVLT